MAPLPKVQVNQTPTLTPGLSPAATGIPVATGYMEGVFNRVRSISTPLDHPDRFTLLPHRDPAETAPPPDPDEPAAPPKGKTLRLASQPTRPTPIQIAGAQSCRQVAPSRQILDELCSRIPELADIKFVG